MIPCGERTTRWTARIRVDYREIHLGCFKTRAEAVAARDAGERERFGEFSPTRRTAAAFR